MCIRDRCASLGKKLLIRPEYTDILMGTSHVEQFDDLMMISVNMFSLSSGQDVYKRQVKINEPR